MTSVIVERLTGSTSVRVLAIGHDAPKNWAPAGLRGLQLEVHYRPGTRDPRVGEILDTWIDVSTTYALAPSQESGVQPLKQALTLDRYARVIDAIKLNRERPMPDAERQAALCVIAGEIARIAWAPHCQDAARTLALETLHFAETLGDHDPLDALNALALRGLLR